MRTLHTSPRSPWARETSCSGGIGSAAGDATRGGMRTGHDQHTRRSIRDGGHTGTTAASFATPSTLPCLLPGDTPENISFFGGFPVAVANVSGVCVRNQHAPPPAFLTKTHRRSHKPRFRMTRVGIHAVRRPVPASTAASGTARCRMRTGMCGKPTGTATRRPRFGSAGAVRAPP